MINALILAREGTTVPDTSCYAPVLPVLDSPAELGRWEPWVRAYIAVGELLRGVDFGVSNGQFQVVANVTDVIAQIGRPLDTTFKAQIPLVLAWSELRYERAVEVLAQIDPQYAFWSSIIGMRPDNARRTMELINTVLQFCVYVEMRFKHALACWRPVEYNAQVQPMITTPGHGSFPSGHATQAYAVAHVLKALLPLQAAQFATVVEQLDRQAARIATNRVVAGVHFPVDSMAGRMLGVALGEYFVGRCGQTQTFMARTFNAAHMDLNPSTDFNPFQAGQGLGAGTFYSQTTGSAIAQSPLMKSLWDAAALEWARFP
ncbi:MAG: phosphatase PAP2 family protein [Rhodoferax sp.]|nr:phosphatase PAP2 family protein [Rhodoferax sp.]